MCFPVKDKSEKQQKPPLLLTMCYLSPCHIHCQQRQYFNVNRSHVQYFGAFGKRSYSEVHCLRCVLLSLYVLQKLLLLLSLRVRWDQQQLRVKVRSIRIFMFIFYSFLPVKTGKPRNFSCHTSYLSIYRRCRVSMKLSHFHLCTKIPSVEFIHATTG